MIVSMGLSIGGKSFTAVGKPAPPMPTMPASRTRPTRSSWARRDHSGSGASGCSSPLSSVSMTMAGAERPDGVGADGRISFTTPADGAWMSAEISPFWRAIGWYFATWSPTATHGMAGAPRCCDIEIVSMPGSGMRRRGLASAIALESGGCAPPLKMFATALMIRCS